MLKVQVHRIFKTSSLQYYETHVHRFINHTARMKITNCHFLYRHIFFLVLHVPFQLSQFTEVNKRNKEKSKITKYTAEKNGYNNEQLYKITNNTIEKKSK